MTDVLAVCRACVFHGVLVLLVSACAPGSTRSGDETGDLGVSQPDSAGDVYVNLAIAYLQEGDVATALRRVKQGLAVDDRNAKGHTVIAIIYDRLGEAELADEHFQRALGIQPRDPYSLNAYGSFLCRQGKHVKAIEQFEAALVNPLYETPFVALTNAGTCAQLGGDLSAAETFLRRALNFNDQFPPALAEMAKVSFARENYFSCRAYLERYLSVANPTAELLWLGVRAERELGNRGAAELYGQELRKTFPDAPEVQWLRESSQR